MAAERKLSRRIYVGTYTKGKSRGIYRCRFLADTGELTALELAAETVNPSFLALHPSGRVVYAVNELNPQGAVSAFAVESAGLRLLNRVASHGADPCYVAVNATGQCLLAANYTSGSVAVFPLAPDGSVGEAATVVQHGGKTPHPHQMYLTPGEQFVLTPDLGNDEVVTYGFDAKRAAIERRGALRVEAGSGPRHVAFHPNGRWVYLIHELNCTVSALEYDAARGSLRALQTVSTLPADFHGESDAAEVAVDATGRFVYCSHRGHDSIAVFAIDESRGEVTLVEHVATGGRTRHFVIDPSGGFLLAANEDTDSIVIFSVDAASGRLRETARIEAPAPVCLLFERS